MKTKLFLIAVMFVLGFSSCSPYVDPRTHYPPHYRHYQDRTHGGIDEEHGGQGYRY